MSRRGAGLACVLGIAGLLLLLVLTGGFGLLPGIGGGAADLAEQLGASAHLSPVDGDGAQTGAGGKRSAGRAREAGSAGHPGDPDATGRAPGSDPNAAAGAGEELLAEDGTGRPGRGAVHLRVLDAEGKPVAGARVALAIDPADRPPEEGPDVDAIARVRGTTGADGAVRLGVDFRGPWDEEETSLHIRAAGFAPRLLPDIRIRAGVDRDLGEVRLAPGHGIEGRVLDAGGLTVAGAAVWVRRPNTSTAFDLAAGPTPDAVRTGPDGAFRLTDLPPGALVVRAVADGHGPGAAHLASSAAGPVELRLTTGVLLRGRVVRDQGPLPPMQVSAYGGGQDVPSLRVAVGPDGAFAIPGVPLGQLYLAAAARDGSLSGHLSTVLKPFQEPVELHVSESKPGETGVLSGTVVDAETGAPIGRFRGAWVAETPAEGDQSPDFNTNWEDFSAGDGRFRFEDLDAAVYAIRVRARGYAEGRVDVTLQEGAARTDLTLALAREGGVLAGVVQRRADRSPVAGARVVPFRQVGPADLEWTEDDELHTPALTGADGTFRIPRVGPGPVSLRIEGGEVGLGSATVASADPAKGPVEVLLDAAATVAGTLRDASGNLVVGEGVVAVESAEEESLRLEARTDDDGRFTIRGLRPGAWLVGPLPDARSGGRNPICPQALQVAAGDRREVALTLPPPSRLLGLVRGIGPNPTWVVVTVQPLDGGASEAMPVGPDGTFRSGDLVPGRYMLSARVGNGFPSPSRTVTLGAGESLRVELEAPPQGHLRLTITTRDGRPVARRTGIGLVRTAPGGASVIDQAWAWIADDGVADVRGIPSGHFRIEIWGTTPSLRGEFDLAAGQEEATATVAPGEGG